MLEKMLITDIVDELCDGAETAEMIVESFDNVCNLLKFTNQNLLKLVNDWGLSIHLERNKTDSYVEYELKRLPDILHFVHRLELAYHMNENREFLLTYNCVNEDELDFITNVADLVMYIVSVLNS
jgi:hypothetical protein